MTKTMQYFTNNGGYMYRIGIDEYFLKMASLVSERATCVRRKVGCVLVNERKHVLSTGYNGAPTGIANCIEYGCKAQRSESGTNLDNCIAVHAEENALIQCKNVFEIETCYCTTFPCSRCLRMLMNTSCINIVYLEEYANSVENSIVWISSKKNRSTHKWGEKWIY